MANLIPWKGKKEESGDLADVCNVCELYLVLECWFIVYSDAMCSVIV